MTNNKLHYTEYRKVASVFHTIKSWAPLFSVILILSGAVSSAVVYLAKTEARELIKQEMEGPLSVLHDKVDEQQKKIEEIEMQSSSNGGKLDMLITLMTKQNEMLKQRGN